MNERISINPSICHGKPVIKNTRILISNILSDLASGESFSNILQNYPTLIRRGHKSCTPIRQ